MIDFDHWFANIVASSDLIAFEDALWRTWVLAEKGITSAYDYNELAEQMLGDLDAQSQVQRFSDRLRDIGALAAVAGFTAAFADVDKAVKAEPTLLDPKELLQSSPWTALRKAARDVLALPNAGPYRKRFT